MILAHGGAADGTPASLLLIIPVTLFALWVHLAAHTRSSGTVLAGVAGGGAFGAALLHFAVVPEHLRSWVLAGLFFVVCGVFQLWLSARLAVGPSRPVLLAGWLGSLALVGLWMWSRTSGLPFGPSGRERVGAVDLVCVGAELVTAVLCAHLLGRPAIERCYGEVEAAEGAERAEVAELAEAK